jgi:YD repeat-containing protein
LARGIRTHPYDNLNRQTQVKDALGNLSTTVYAAAGNVTNTIDARAP